MMELEYAARGLVRTQEAIRSSEESLKENKRVFVDSIREYQDEWKRVFHQKLEDSGRTWCSYCGLIILKESAKERYSLYSKSDNYGPVFAHTSTKYRVCTICSESLSTADQAKEFKAMFNEDHSEKLPSLSLDAAKDLFQMPAYDPLKDVNDS